MAVAHRSNLESVQGDAEAVQSEPNSESKPLFEQIRFETFGEGTFNTESPITLLEQAREHALAPINFYLSDSPPKETKAAYEIPEENRLNIFSKASNYATHAWAYGLMGVSAGIALSKNPFIRAGCGVLFSAVGINEARFSIHGQELKDLKIRHNVLFPKKS